MSNWHAVVGIIAGFFSILGYLPYYITISQGKTRPNRATWWIWATLGTITAASYYSSGARVTMWVPIFYAVNQLIVALVSIKFGKGGWTRFDRTCLVGAGLSLVLWWMFDSPLVALLINLMIDSLGALPTIRQVYNEPETEDLLSWSIFWIANTLNLVAVDQWSIAILAFPLYLFILATTMVTLLLRPKVKVLRTLLPRPKPYQRRRRRNFAQSRFFYVGQPYGSDRNFSNP